MLERRGQLAKRPNLPVIEGDGKEISLEEEDPLPRRRLEPIPTLPTPWHKNPWFVVPMFCLCVGLLVWIFFFRGPTPEELMASARPLLESDNPADWERAWNDYLEPLSRKYPDRYPEELKEARRRLDEQGEMRRSLAAGKVVRYHSEAERFYYEGLRLSQAGEFSAARQMWRNVVRAFSSIESDKHWVQLAGIGLDRLPPREEMVLRPSTTTDLKTTLQPIFAEIRQLRQNGKMKEADSIRQAIDMLYRDDPEGQKVREWLEEK